MSSLARPRPAFVAESRPSASANDAKVFGFPGRTAHVVADDDEPYDHDLLDEETEQPEPQPRKTGSFRGVGGVEPSIDDGEPGDEQDDANPGREELIKTLKVLVKAANTEVNRAGKDADRARKAKDKAEDDAAMLATIAEKMAEGTDKRIVAEAKAERAAKAAHRASEEYNRLAERAREAARVRDAHQHDLDVAVSATSTPEKASPPVKFLNHCLADRWFRVGGKDDQVFYRWTGVYWKAVDEWELMKDAGFFAKVQTPEKADCRVARSMLDYALSQMVGDHEKPQTPEGMILIQLKNAVIELRRVEETVNGKESVKVVAIAHAPNPDFGTTSCVNAELDWSRVDPRTHVYAILPLDATSTEFGAFIWSTCGGDLEVVRYFAEAFGSLITGDRMWQRAILLIGRAGSGKSSMTSIITAFLTRFCSVECDKLGDTFALQETLGKDLLIEDEVTGISEKHFKMIAAGAPIQVTRKNLPPVTVRLRGRFLLSANEVPVFRDTQKAIARRLVILKFDVQRNKAGRKMDWDAKVKNSNKEMTAVVDFLLEGAARLVARGDFLPDEEAPAAIRDIKNHVLQENDPVAPFIAKFNVKESKEFVSERKAVYAAYRAMKEEHGTEKRYILTHDSFFNKLGGTIDIGPRVRIGAAREDYCYLTMTGVTPIKR
ncbi:hypothetical protein KDX26_19405 [Burkholderia cenocepacia]|uniref:DUF5906 domain-containing protein n=1 Tax=Burkholderia cenocepacia TaxID=95486 RepID=UPI001B9E2A9C|nr:DUF5906 domain-containing protein [Burkholderia cenocepacia]MBR8384567.1 hypothetical protein [Burkholderia cenocepacia]